MVGRLDGSACADWMGRGALGFVHSYTRPGGPSPG